MRQHGHVDVDLYPVAYLREEARMVTRRINSEAVSAALLVQGAIISVLSKDGGKYFAKQTASLTDED